MVISKSEYLAWKCGGLCSLKFIKITIPKNLLISGIYIPFYLVAKIGILSGLIFIIVLLLSARESYSEELV
jgi:hypothetical protein